MEHRLTNEIRNTALGATTNNTGDYMDLLRTGYCEPAYMRYYPWYPSWGSHTVVVEKDSKFDRAFKILDTLMKDGYLKIEKIEDFISLVRKISDQL